MSNVVDFPSKDKTKDESALEVGDVVSRTIPMCTCTDEGTPFTVGMVLDRDTGRGVLSELVCTECGMMVSIEEGLVDVSQLTEPE